MSTIIARLGRMAIVTLVPECLLALVLLGAQLLRPVEPAAAAADMPLHSASEVNAARNAASKLYSEPEVAETPLITLTSPGWLWAGTDGLWSVEKGVWRYNVFAGTGWERRSNGLGNVTIEDLQLSPHDDNVLRVHL